LRAVAPHDVFGNVLKDGQGNLILNDEWPLLLQNDGRASDWELKYTVTFTPRPYEIRTDTEITNPANQPNQGEVERYIERQKRSAVQNLPLPTVNAYKFSKQLSPFQGGGVAVGNAAVGQNLPPSAAQLILPTEELLYTW